MQIQLCLRLNVPTLPPTSSESYDTISKAWRSHGSLGLTNFIFCLSLNPSTLTLLLISYTTNKFLTEYEPAVCRGRLLIPLFPYVTLPELTLSLSLAFRLPSARFPTTAQ
jgi:hypothetical protein